MKFAGELRIPDIDHPGIPAAVVIDDTHIEIVLDGESLGKWSLYDVRARRLISKAFALDLAGEDVTFLSEEPVDFAYRGVERMAQVWAQFKTMRGPQRMLAVRRSRSRATPSRVSELRAAMEANLAAQRNARPAPKVEPAVEATPSVPPPNRRPAQPSSVFKDPDEVPVQPTTETQPGTSVASVRSAKRRDEIDARKRLDALRQEAVERDNKRIEAFRAEMAKLEAERSEAERVAAEYQTNRATELERLKTEMRVLKEREAGLAKGDTAGLEALHIAIEQIETHRHSLEQSNLDAVRKLHSFEVKRTELERREAARWQSHRREMERIKAEMVLLDRADAGQADRQDEVNPFMEEEVASPVDETIADPPPEESQTDLSDDDGAQIADPPSEEGHAAEVSEESADAESIEVAEELASAEVVEVVAVELVDAAALRNPATVTPAPLKEAAAGDRKRGGLVGSVRSAFLRDGKEHEHIFVSAPATLGLTRSICSECGYVSIGAAQD